MHRPGESALHKGPDGISRNAEGRDQLILARSTEWTNYRNRIRGICEDIVEGKADTTAEKIAPACDGADVHNRGTRVLEEVNGGLFVWA